MNCKNCNTQISAAAAHYCPCGSGDYCPHCAATFGICDCYQDMKRYS
ncbi:MAG: hypothetical protein FWH03_01550 [Firmicutes bacterium]|nr:hypothetical protein [Bacillota bacterium]